MKNILFLDIETTGLNPDSAELIELSAVRTPLSAGKETAVFDSLVKPDGEIPPFVQKLTGISPDMVLNAPVFDDVHEEFKSFLEPDDIICGHNIMFDVGFLNAKGYDLKNPTLDTFSLCQFVLPNELSYSLEILSEKYQIHHDDAHRALADVRANLDLYKILLEKASQYPTSLKQEWQQVMSKSTWTGTVFFDVLPNGENLEQQSSIFDSPDSQEASAKEAQIKLEQNVVDALVESITDEGQALIQLPPRLDHAEHAFAAARNAQKKTGEPVAVVSVKETLRDIPADYAFFAAPANSIDIKTFTNWIASAARLPEAETVLALKLLREIEFNRPLAISALPLARNEEAIARRFTAEKHSPSLTPQLTGGLTKAALFEDDCQELYACDFFDFAACPAKRAIVLDADLLEKKLDKAFLQSVNLQFLERVLSENNLLETEIGEKLLFAIGLLRRFFSERTNHNPYRAHLIFSEAVLQETEAKNLAAEFSQILEPAKTDSLLPTVAIARERISVWCTFPRWQHDAL